MAPSTSNVTAKNEVATYSITPSSGALTLSGSPIAAGIFPISLALDPSVGTDWSEHYVEVETESELTRGMTIVDRLNVADDERNRAVWAPALEGRKAKVYWTIDNQRWKEALYTALQ